MNYDMYVDRTNSDPISLSDYNMHLKFFFMGPSGFPEPLRPEIGKFVLHGSSYNFTGGQFIMNHTSVEIEEIDYTEKSYPETKWFNGYPVKGVYTAKDHS